jgi:hypothetical protein
MRHLALIAGSTAVITGATSSIGLATAKPAAILKPFSSYNALKDASECEINPLAQWTF